MGLLSCESTNSRLTLRTMLHDDEFNNPDEDLDEEPLEGVEEEDDTLEDEEEEDTF